ncbi:hypothetical protein Tco_0394440 [Tanacetum coccineum]
MLTHRALSNSSLVSVLVLSLWAIIPVVPLIPTFIASSLLTCPSAPLVVSSIGICRTPIISRRQDGNSVHLWFWEHMDHHAWRSAGVLIFLSISLVTNSIASCIVLGLDALTPSWIIVASVYNFGYVANLLAISALYNVRSIMVKFALVAQRYLQQQTSNDALADGDRGVWCKIDIRTVRDLVLENIMIWCGEVGGVEADSSVSNASVSFTTSSSSSSSSDDSLSSLSPLSTGWSAGSSLGSSSSSSV